MSKSKFRKIAAGIYVLREDPRFSLFGWQHGWDIFCCGEIGDYFGTYSTKAEAAERLLSCSTEERDKAYQHHIKKDKSEERAMTMMADWNNQKQQ